LAWIALAELLLLLLGWKLGSLAWPLAGAFAVVFAVVAYRAPEVAWILVWMAFPFSREIVVPGGAALSMPTEPMMVIALAVWFLRRWPWRDLSAGPSSIARPLALVAAIALLSVAVSKVPMIGIKAWIIAGLYTAFGYLYFVSTHLRPRRILLWIGMGVLLASFLSTYASVRVLSTGGGFRMAYGAARPFFVEHGTFAAYLAFFLPPAIVESVAGDGRRRFLWGAGVAIILAGIVLTFTRAAWISVALVLPVLLVALGRARGGTARLLVPVSIVALVGLGIASTKLAEPLVGHVRTIVTTGNVSNLERLNRWTAAVEMTKARPLTGVGYGAYGEEYRTYRRKSIVTEQSLSMFGAHNELLRMLAETGWPGLVAAIWFLLAVAIAGVGTFARDPQSARGRLALGIVCGLATYAIHSLFNSYLGIDKISVPFWVFVGMLSALAATPRKTSEDLVKVA